MAQILGWFSAERHTSKLSPEELDICEHVERIARKAAEIEETKIDLHTSLVTEDSFMTLTRVQELEAYKDLTNFLQRYSEENQNSTRVAGICQRLLKIHNECQRRRSQASYNLMSKEMQDMIGAEEDTNTDDTLQSFVVQVSNLLRQQRKLRNSTNPNSFKLLSNTKGNGEVEANSLESVEANFGAIVEQLKKSIEQYNEMDQAETYEERSKLFAKLTGGELTGSELTNTEVETEKPQDKQITKIPVPIRRRPRRTSSKYDL